MIEIIKDIDQKHIDNIQTHYSSFYRREGQGEEYYSSDKTKSLKMKYKGEFPFGPKYFSAKLYDLTSNKQTGKTIYNFNGLLTLNRRFKSLGSYGNNYDHWAGNPWSNDSKYISLVEIDTQGDMSTLFIFDVEKRNMIKVNDQFDDLVGHHMWAPNDKYYLFRGSNCIYLYSFENNNVFLVFESTSYQKHFYFDSSSEFVITLVDNQILKIFSIALLKIVDEISLSPYLNDKDKACCSMWDPFKHRMIIGSTTHKNVGNIYAKREKWLAVDIH